MKKSFLSSMVALVVAFTLAACGTMQAPQSPQDYLQSAKAQVGAAYKTIGDLKASGSITTEQGIEYFRKVEAVEKQVRAAEAVMATGDTKTAQGSLQLALSALLAISTELKGYKKAEWRGPVTHPLFALATVA